jgi:hypothetical protein
MDPLLDPGAKQGAEIARLGLLEPQEWHVGGRNETRDSARAISKCVFEQFGIEHGSSGVEGPHRVPFWPLSGFFEMRWHLSDHSADFIDTCRVA